VNAARLFLHVFSETKKENFLLDKDYWISCETKVWYF
jgi:hypothetical protein